MADQVSGEQVVPQPEDSTAPAPYADVVEDEDLLDDENAPPMPDYKIIMDQNFYYPTDHIENALEDSPISRRMAEFHDTFGVDSYKLYNFRLLDPNTVIYAAGISYKIHNLKTGGVSIFFSKDGGGVASIAVDKAQKYFAVAEKGSQPNIYVYEYPSLKLYRILRHGTEKSYSNCSFSSGGERLASVGSEPDYNICIWDWRNEILVLKAKAFSQEVFRVVFSDYSDTILSTSGMAHLRFWKIANTFTGLKLKGQTGKFGSVELSDIIGFFIFPDGKVLSGSENGKLLLWEGNLIKAVLNVTADKNCHEGAINTVIKVGPHLVSAGQDGYIRYWDFKTIDDCEADDYLNYFISPEKEYQIIPDGANVQEIVVYKEYWLVHDAKGRLFRVKVTTAGIQTEELFRFNSGKFKGLASSQDFNAVASIGQDGAIRLLDITNRKQYYNREFLGSGTCIDWCLKGLDKYGGRFAAVGFDNGIVRIVHFSQDKLFLLKALKVHNNPVTLVSFSPSSDMLAVLSSLGEIFFFAVSPDSQGGLNLTPICIHPLLKKVNQWCWGSRRSTLLIATDSGEVVELEVPQLGEFDSTQTYLNEKVKSRTFVIKMMEFQRPKIDVNSVNYLLDEKSPIVFVEWEPAPISSVTYLDEEEGRFLCAAEGPFLGYIYMCQFGEERPLQALPATQSAIRIINRSPDNNWILSGTDAGEVLIRPMSNVLSFAKLNLHDQNHGSVVGLALNPDMTCVVSASEDGTIMTQLIDLKFAQECAQLRHLQKIDREKRKQRKLMQLDEPAEEDKKEDGEPEEEGKAPEDDESSEDSAEGKFKADQYDFSIAALKPNIPSLTEGINETFFGGDMAGRTDSEDILNPNIYSIQEEKLLAEEDKRKSLAEERKKKMRADIATLRERFENLKKNNMSLDEFLRLEAKDFNIDDEYTQMLKARVAEMLDEAQKEVSYEIETSKMKTQKLKDFYLSELEFDRLAVAGFKKNISVHTMKVKFPSEWTQAFWRETDQKKLANASTAEAAGMQNQARDMGMSDQNKGTQGLLGSQEHNGDPNSIGGIIDQWINQNENKPIGQNYLKEKKEQLRKQQADKKRLEKEVAEKRGDKPAQEEKYTRQKIKADKELRSQMKQELSKRKPEDKKIGDDDPKIKEAKDKMGLYKLKSDPEYEVPDKQRMSMKRQRKTILLFEDFIHKTKREFNKSLLQMKDTKKHLFDKIIASNQRIREINERLRQLNPELKVEDALFVPSYNELLEFPDKFMQVTPEEVEDELKAREEDKKKKGAKGVADSKEEALGASGESDALAKSGTEKKPRVELQYRERKNIKTFPSAMEARHKEIMQLRLETEKRLLSEELETEILDFDERLEELAFKKIRFEYEMKFIQMNLITSYQELLILDAFEAKDKLLLEEHDRLNTKAKETSEAMKKNSAAIQKNRIDAKISEQNVKDAEAKFNEKLAGSKELANKAYEFYKQINQKKEKKSGEDDADNQDGGLDDDEDVRELINNWNSDYGTSTFVRDRYEKEMARAEITKNYNILNDEKIKLEGEQKRGENALLATRTHIKKLQKEKLERVSTLYVSYFLRLHQVQNLWGMKVDRDQYEVLPPTMEKSVLFTQQALNSLHAALGELTKNIAAIKADKDKLNKEQRSLERDKGFLVKAHKEALAECEEIYQLKFGERHGQEVLDSLEPTPKLKALQKEFEKEEKITVRKIQEAERELKETKQELLAIKKKNTKIINYITKKGNQQLELNKNLDSSNNEVTKEDKDNKKSDVLNFRQHLEEIIKLFNAQIEKVQAEIHLYKQKGGRLTVPLIDGTGQSDYQAN